tara:strand:- start:711 stop:1625 length:915 start_codon:yes stop_codon:yes gene_type:complete
MSSVLKKKYLFLILILVLAPVARELSFGLLAHDHAPFGTVHDLIHTTAEMGFMLLTSLFIVVIDFRLFREKIINKQLNHLVEEKTQEIVCTQKASIEALASLAEYRDTDTGQHLERIQNYVHLIVRGLLEKSPYKKHLENIIGFIDDVTLASILHDIGKVAIPDHILFKPGKLNDEEFEIIKQHAIAGGKILEAANKKIKKNTNMISYLDYAQDIANYHHEKWDGTGYPEGLFQEETPIVARIVALCDVYDAVTTDRVYKKAWSHEKARDVILKNRGQHFDPVITDVFERLEGTFNRTRIMYQK